jgi:hypothetical protein
MLRFLTLFLTAVGLALYAAQLMELEPRVQYDSQLYAVITHPYYRLFKIAGLALQVGAVVAAIALAVAVRHRPAFGLVVCAVVSLIAALVFWGGLVMPVNSEWLGTIREMVPMSDDYARLGARWEFGHALAFIAWMGGAILLMLAKGLDADEIESEPEHLPQHA